MRRVAMPRDKLISGQTLAVELDVRTVQAAVEGDNVVARDRFEVALFRVAAEAVAHDRLYSRLRLLEIIAASRIEDFELARSCRANLLSRRPHYRLERLKCRLTFRYARKKKFLTEPRIAVQLLLRASDDLHRDRSALLRRLPLTRR